jgi:hypothetical protein
MTFYKGAFTEYYRLDQPIMITTATGALLQGVAEGTVELQIKEDSYYKIVRLSEVLYVIGLSGNLILVLQLQDKGISVATKATPKTGLELSLDRRKLAIVTRVGRSYILSTRLLDPEVAYRTQETISPELFYRRFCHMSYSSFRGIEAVTTGLTSPLQPLDEHYSGCTLAKAMAVISRNQPEKTTKKLGRVWID